MDEGLKKYDCLVTLSQVVENKMHTPNKYSYMFYEFDLEYALVRFIMYRYIVALDLYKTEYNNFANQVHLWFEKQCDSTTTTISFICMTITKCYSIAKAT